MKNGPQRGNCFIILPCYATYILASLLHPLTLSVSFSGLPSTLSSLLQNSYYIQGQRTSAWIHTITCNISTVPMGSIVQSNIRSSSIDILSYTFTVTEIVHHKSLLGTHIMEIQNQNLSRLITCNQVPTIPLHIIGFCISPTQLKDIFSSGCILNPTWTISML